MRTLYRTASVLVLLVQVWLGHAGPAEARKYLDAIDAQERLIIQDLYDGQIVWAERFGRDGNTGSLWKIKIENQGRTRWAVFKPREFGDRDGWARTPMETAVYKLDRILGLDLVPPVGYRRNVSVGGTFYQEGAVMLWVDDVHGIDRVPEAEWSPSREVFSSDLRVLQTISRDADNQNGKNIGRGRHWKDGRWRVMKFDNESAMRHGAYVELGHHLPTWNEVRRFRHRTYERLKELNFNDLKGDLGEFISDDEIRDWLHTRDGLVSYVERESRMRQVFFSDQELAFHASTRRGPASSPAFRAKFKSLMAEKGVAIDYLKARDPRLDGADGKTVLLDDGIHVYLRRDATRATLTEELVHVNQLWRMARNAGGLQTLHERLSKDPSDLIVGSLEEYARGRAALGLRGDERRQAELEARGLHDALVRRGVRPQATRTAWNRVGRGAVEGADARGRAVGSARANR